MRKSIQISLVTILLSMLSLSVYSQNDYFSSRLDSYATQLKRQTVDLADRTSNDLRRGFTVPRADLEVAFLAQQMDGSASLFQQMVADKRSAGELRDAAAILAEISRRAPAFGTYSYQWRSIQDSVASINRELGSYGGGTPPIEPPRPVLGRINWRGTVDDKVQLKVSTKSIETITVSGTPYADAKFDFTKPLPTTAVTLEINKKKGRGSVRVIQQPNRQNDFTALIEIRDGDGGAREYQIEIYWR
jgi:hypothetical protein